MGRNEEEWLRNKQDYLKKLEENIDSIATSDVAKLTTSSDIAVISLMLSRVADALEELNENIKNLAADRNTNTAHTDDGK